MNVTRKFAFIDLGDDVYEVIEIFIDSTGKIVVD